MSTSGGTMLETLMRLTLPIPAASNALSNAFSGVPPSAVPAVTEAFVTCFQNIGISLRAALVARERRDRTSPSPAAGRHHHWRESKTQAFFPCAASLVLYNSADFRPVSHRRKRDRGDGERGAIEPASQFDDRRRSRARKGVGIGESGSSPAARAVRLQLRGPQQP